MDARIVRRPAPSRAVSAEENSDLIRQLAFHPRDLKALKSTGSAVPACAPPAPPRRTAVEAASEAPPGSTTPSGFSNPTPSLQLVCPGCRKELKARIELAGKTGKCPSCGHLLAIRPLGPAPAPAMALADMPPVVRQLPGGSVRAADSSPHDAASNPAPTVEPSLPFQRRLAIQQIAFTLIAPALLVGLFFALRGLSSQADQFSFVGLYLMFVLIILSFFTAAKLFTGIGGYMERFTSL